MTQPRHSMPGRPRPRFRTVRVSRVERITPHLVRVTFTGDDWEGFTTHGAAEHLKVFFPAAGQERPVLPTWGADGPVYAEGQERPVSRTYTPRRWDPEARELEIDFVLHGDGLGSSWAERAQPGDLVAITDPGGPYRPDPDADWYLIGGDESALPAIATILRPLPASMHAQVFVEVVDAAEHQELESQAQVVVTWLHRGPEKGIAGRRVEAAIRDFEFPDGQGRVWVGCESSVMRDIRRHLLNERDLERGAIHTQGYWKYGVTNHPDHDLGREI